MRVFSSLLSCFSAQSLGHQALGQALADWVAQPHSRQDENRPEALQRIQHCFDKYENGLNLSGLGLTSLPNCFSELPLLTAIDLSQNRLTGLPPSLADLRGLQALNLQANQLAIFPAEASKLPALTTLNLSDNQLETLPEPLVNSQNLRTLLLANNRLTELPESVLDRVASPFFVFNLVWDGNPLEPHIRERLANSQQPLTLPPGIGATVPPGPQLARWYEDLGLTLEPRDWHNDTSLEAVNFGRCLEMLFRTEDYKQTSTREAFKERVKNILLAIDENPVLRERIFAEALSATGTCQDATTVGFNRMDLALQDHRAASGELSPSDIFKIGRGMFRLQLMEKIARPLTERNDEAVERWLDLLVALRDELSLPVASARMHYHADLSQDTRDYVKQTVLHRENFVSPDDALKKLKEKLESAGEQTVSRVATPLPKNALAYHLATEYTPWAKQVGRESPDVVEEFKTRAKHLQEAIEDAAQQGKISDEEYIRACRSTLFLHNHGAAYRKALETMMESGSAPTEDKTS